ncbi:MAG: universal stress protein [Thermoplasmata archaeon]|jgi:nucleotide-binding universal stress UspA family protein|nr:universal stress protein [Thermoplasmata archaeon]
MTVHSIVVAFDGSPESIVASNEAADIARLTKARLTIVGVVSLVSRGFGVSLPAGEGVERTIAESRAALEVEKSRIVKRGLPGVEAHLLEGDPVAAVVGFVEKNSVDLIVVGSRGLDALGRFFLGSVSDGILHYARCSVLVAKAPAAEKKPSP